MKYFKSKVVYQGDEILTFVAPIVPMNESPKHLMYDRQGDIEYHGLPDDVSSDEVLALQHEECEVEEVTFADIVEILKQCRLYKEINAQIEQRIRHQFSIGDEFSILKLDKTSDEYISYQQKVDEAREAGRLQKTALGLKQ